MPVLSQRSLGLSRTFFLFCFQVVIQFLARNDQKEPHARDPDSDPKYHNPRKSSSAFTLSIKRECFCVQPWYLFPK